MYLRNHRVTRIPQLFVVNWVSSFEQLKRAAIEEEARTKFQGRGKDKMKIPLKTTLLSASLLALLLPAVAQTSSAPAQNPAAPAQATTPAQPSTPAQTSPAETINQHKNNQQERIANGISNGSLTAGEASSLEKQETNMNVEENKMKQLDNGHLTAADKAALRQQQNQLSNQIYQDKHNATNQNLNPTGQIGKTAENQQDRIASGVKSGQLTAGEASTLETEESNINKEAAQERKANGGHLTAQERAQVKAQQNNMSKQIYKDKHNNVKR
jgi:hypothetical protein